LKDYKHIDTKLVNQAVEDRANGNRPLTSRAYLERRIAEIQYDRMKEHEEFAKFFSQVFMKVKE
jgi:hypothetical protein